MAADAAKDMGYTNLMVYQAGMPDWISHRYPVLKGSEPGKLR
jgi:hypothetical protein